MAKIAPIKPRTSNQTLCQKILIYIKLSCVCSHKDAKDAKDGYTRLKTLKMAKVPYRRTNEYDTSDIEPHNTNAVLISGISDLSQPALKRAGCDKSGKVTMAQCSRLGTQNVC